MAEWSSYDSSHKAENNDSSFLKKFTHANFQGKIKKKNPLPPKQLLPHP
jgi:hypothetical protein